MLPYEAYITLKNYFKGNKMKKTTIIVAGVIAASALALFFKKDYDRAAFVSNLFTGAEQYENFSNIKEMMPVSEMKAAEIPFDFDEGESITLPKSFIYEGKNINTEAFLSETDTSALLVIHQGKVSFENYYLTGGREVNWLSMSLAKSFIATAIGIAVDDGLIDIQKHITDYVPSLIGSAYDKVRVKDVLQMSSGAVWNEDYSDPESDVMKLGMIMATGGSMSEFIAGMQREYEPGTVNRYNSGDTQALGMLLQAATKTSITNYVQDKLWTPLGMESSAYWIVDDRDVEMAFGGLNATARDYAKLGELYRLKGNWHGKQLVSEKWIHDSTTPDAPHLMPNAIQPHIGEASPDDFGYGYQWWIPPSKEGEYLAIGVYNQFIYINPTSDVVIVKLSAYSDYSLKNEIEYFKEYESLELFREISNKFNAEKFALSH
jgi:CubicO group peptidase (beta-lactamase class C family)